MLFALENLVRQYLACRRNKRNTVNALRFEARQELNLLALRQALVQRTYEPARSVCFFVRRPKLREVFAADFRDRVVHHVLVSHLEQTWEPIFIADSYACRRGKGVHAAVARLQQFMRQVTVNGTREAWALQLDIHNYFMSIDKARLLAMLDAKLKDDDARWLTEKLVFHDCTLDPVLKGDSRWVDKLPPHKTLFRAPSGKGLPIGNLNSQFFANVYLNALDQFVKHELKCRWYLRYCDDFVLLAHSREQLEAWRERIRDFLREALLLELNDARERLRPIGDGLDFLGYIVRPFHLLVRRRVVGHLRERLQRFERALVARHEPEGQPRGRTPEPKARRYSSGHATEYRFDPAVLDVLQASLASYFGHFKPAATRRLEAALWRQHGWLAQFFTLHTDGRLRRRDCGAPRARNVLQQYRHWREVFAGDVVLMQIGAFIEQLQWPPRRLVVGHGSTPGESAAFNGLRRMRPTRRGARCGFPADQLGRRVAALLRAGKSVTLVAQTGQFDGRLEQRRPTRRWSPVAAGLPSGAR